MMQQNMMRFHSSFIQRPADYLPFFLSVKPRNINALNKSYRSAVIVLLMSFIALFPIQAFAERPQPELTKEEAAKIIDLALKEQPLFWQGFAIPYSIDRASTHKDAAMLKILFNHGLLTRSKETKVESLDGGKRKRITMNHRYDFVDKETGDLIESQGGFYYGYGRLKSIMQLSKPYLIGQDYYAEAYIQWYVDDIQDWVDAPAFDKARTLRRTLESKSKPFEKRVYLHNNGESWAFWKGPPAAL